MKWDLHISSQFDGFNEPLQATPCQQYTSWFTGIAPFSSIHIYHMTVREYHWSSGHLAILPPRDSDKMYLEVSIDATYILQFHEHGKNK